MACSCVRPNYKGPGVGIWALALGLQFAVGALMIFLGAQSTDVSGLQNIDLTQSSLYEDGNASKVVNVLGWLHLLFAVVCGAFVVLGLFVCGIFLCPLCVLGWIQSLFCLISTCTTAAYLRGYLDKMKDPSNDSSVFKTGDLLFASQNCGGLLLACVLAFAACVLLSRATKVSSGESVTGSVLMIFSMGLYGATGAILACGGGGLSPTPALSVLWVTLTVIGAFFMNVRSCFCEKLCNVFMIVLFGVGAALAFITTVVLACIYSTTTRDIDARPEFMLLVQVMQDGKGFFASVGLTAAAFILSLLAALYAARSLLCCGPGVSHN
ncbi:uncharacterized protein LOC113147228 [Cyclospora cayetanensis]|uniref:Uncharacterized protein LOC113147228 n=1 Tax=Cyclospora cayetanensis TaxID=88456 RepID=A0A6P6RY85_9EIME|nr:uncharacterized protein LOC113147228 [Cyclospora cayetanensis]